MVEITANTGPFDSAMSGVQRSLSATNVALGTFAGNVMTTFARMAAQAAGGLFEGTVRSASHLAETMNKTNAVLGDGAAKVIANADDMADRFGFVKKEVLDASSSFAMLGKEMKMSEADAAAFGVKLTRMAADAGSLADMELPEILEKFRAGLAGQVRPLRELGIFMTADAVKQEAARMGLKPNEATGQLSEGDKIKARVSFIENSEFMKKASGDLARTLDQTENQTRKFWGTLANLGTTVGEELNPAWNKLIISLNEGLDSLKEMINSNKNTIKAWGESVVGSFDTAKLVWRNLPDTVGIALLQADEKAADALTKMEQWATKMAVAIEKPFLKGTQSVGDFFNKVSNSLASSAAAAVETPLRAAQSVADAHSNIYNKAVGATASGADAAFRPIRDAANAIERAAGAGNYKQMSVEEDVGRLKGGLGGASGAIGRLADFLKTFRDVADQAAKNPKDFTSGLIGKADKHLQDTLGAGPADHHAAAIAALEENIRKREADRLRAMNPDPWGMDAEEKALLALNKVFDPASLAKPFGGNVQENLRKMGIAVPEMLDKRRRDEQGNLVGDEEDSPLLSNKKKHQKSIVDSAKFAEELQAGQLGGNVQEKQLTELQQIREIEAKNAANLEKMLQRGGMAVFG